MPVIYEIRHHQNVRVQTNIGRGKVGILPSGEFWVLMNNGRMDWWVGKKGQETTFKHDGSIRLNLSQIGRSNDYKLIFSEVFGIGVVQVSSKGFGAELETVQLSGNTDRRRLDYRLPWYEFVRIGVRDYERFGGVEVLTMAVRQVDEKTARKFSEGYRLNGTFVVNIR